MSAVITRHAMIARRQLFGHADARASYVAAGMPFQEMPIYYFRIIFRRIARRAYAESRRILRLAKQKGARALHARVSKPRAKLRDISRATIILLCLFTAFRACHTAMHSIQKDAHDYRRQATACDAKKHGRPPR